MQFSVISEYTEGHRALEAFLYINETFFPNLDTDIIQPLLGGLTDWYVYPPEVNEHVVVLMDALVELNRDIRATTHWNPPNLYSDHNFWLHFENDPAFKSEYRHRVSVLSKTVRVKLAPLLQHCLVLENADSVYFQGNPNDPRTGFPNLQGTAHTVRTAVSRLQDKTTAFGLFCTCHH
eukprot:scaffold4927_cov139-Amphora_coffeaeformis.AAC.3